MNPQETAQDVTIVTRSLLYKQISGNSATSDENVASTREVSYSPRKSTRVANSVFSSAFGVTETSASYAYKWEVEDTITPDDGTPRKHVAVTMLEKVDEDNDFLRKNCSLTRLRSTCQGT